MAHAYSPGLKVLERTIVRRLRRLPLAGDVLVKPGDRVAAEQIVMRTSLPGPADMVNAASILGIMPDDVPRYLLRHAGEAVRKGEAIAERKSLFGLIVNRVMAPMDGSVEAVSHVTGQVTVRGMPVPVEVGAYIDGTVVETVPGESVTIETAASFIQGIFGVGGETSGCIAMAVASPGDVLEPEQIIPAHKDAILVGGSHVAFEAVKKAIGTGVRALITGGFDDADLKRLLGFDLGVAITGHEHLGLSLVVTEGFGAIRMADTTFSLLRSCAGKRASVNGATQIRAGVMRPEIVVPLEAAASCSDSSATAILAPGTTIRAIREPYFGMIGTVTAMPAELTELPTEAKVRVLECRFEDGSCALLPRANVEVIATA